MKMPFNIAVYYDADGDQTGLFLASHRIQILRGEGAKAIFKGICSELERAGYLGRQMETFFDGESYLIERAEPQE